ncbi:MAG: hypothetical protein ABSC42_13545, partial [Tepidisphaeraceae bacterium]
MQRDQASVSKRISSNNIQHGKLVVKRAILALAAGAACEMMFSPAAHGATSTWITESGTTNWSASSTNWVGGIPTSGSTTVVDIFDTANTLGPAGGVSVEADVDSGLSADPFLLNQLNLNGTTTTNAGTGTITIGGSNELELTGSSAQINMNALYGVSGAGAGTTYEINDAINFNAATTITFASTSGGNLNFNDELDGAGTITIQDNTYGSGGSDRPVNFNGLSAGASTFTGNVNIMAGVLALGPTHSILGVNGYSYNSIFNSYSGTAGNQTVTVSSGAAVAFNEVNGAYIEPQNFVINGNGTNSGVQIPGVLGSDAALDDDSVNFSYTDIMGLAVATNSTVRVDESIGSTGPGAIGPNYGPNWGLFVNGPLAGTGTLTKVGTGFLLLSSTAASVGTYSAFTGNVVIEQGGVATSGGNLITGQDANSDVDELGTNPSGTQTVTVLGTAQTGLASGGSMVIESKYGGSANYPQNFILNGNGTGDIQAYNQASPPAPYGVGESLGADAALQVYNTAYDGDFTLGTLSNGSYVNGGGIAIASNATIRVNTAINPQTSADAGNYGLLVYGPLAGTGNLTLIGSNTDQFAAVYDGASGTILQFGGFLELENTAGAVGSYSAFTGNVTVTQGFVLSTGAVADAMGFNYGTGANSTVAGTGSQTVTIQSSGGVGGSFIFNSGQGAYAQPQNFVINGAGTAAASSFAAYPFLGVDAAIQVFNLQYGDTSIGALDVASASTIRVNTNPGAATGLGLIVNGVLTGSSTLTLIGGNGDEFREEANSPDVLQNAGMLEFGGTAAAADSTYTGNIVVANTSAINSGVDGAILATGKANYAMGYNYGTGANSTVAGTGSQTVTIQSGTTMLLNEGNGAYINPQNFILNGAGTGFIGGGIPVGSDSALEADDVNFGIASIGGLDIHTSATIRVNTDPTSSASAPNLGLQVNGPLAGTGTLTLVGSTGDGIENGSSTPFSEDYGTLILTQSAAAVNGTGDSAFSGNVVVGTPGNSTSGPVLELGPVADPLGTSASQTVTVNNMSAVVINGNTGAYPNPQSFIINGTGTGDSTVGAVGAYASLQAVNIANGNATIGGLSVASNSTVSVSSTAPYGLTVTTGLAGTGNLTVIGGGTLILSSAAAASSATGYGAFSGNVAVNSATLDVSNSSGSATGTGSVTLTGGTLISDSGAISGNVSADATSVIAPGGIGTIGTLSLGGLTTVSGASLNFDLGTRVGLGLVTNGSLLTLGSGTTSIGSGTLVDFTGTPVVGDDYRLIGGTIGGITLSHLSPQGAPGGDVFTLSTSVDSGYIDLVVTSSGPASLTWNNTGASSPDNGTTWDTTNNNWNNGSAATTYGDGALVTFNDTNHGNYAVTLNTTVSPGSVTVNNSSGNYTISGSGSIAGTTSLTKLGIGTLA